MWFATSDIDVGTFLAVHCLLRRAPLKGGLRFVRQGVSASQVRTLLLRLALSHCYRSYHCSRQANE